MKPKVVIFASFQISNAYFGHVSITTFFKVRSFKRHTHDFKYPLITLMTHSVAMIDAGLVHASTSYDQVQTKCSKIKTVLVYFLLAIIFVGIALALAVVYTGKEHTKPAGAERRLELEDSARAVSIEEYPFLAAVFSAKPFLFLCSAVVLNERYLLTSANCFSVQLSNNLMVRTGSSLWDEGGKLYEVDKFVVHEDYDSRKFVNNIAVMATTMNITFDDVTQTAKIAAEGKSIFQNASAFIVGWGKCHQL